MFQEETERRFKLLARFFGCYLHEYWLEMYGSPGAAVDAAINDGPVAFRQQVRRELATLLAETSDDIEPGNMLNDGLHVNVYFRKPVEKRAPLPSRLSAR